MELLHFVWEIFCMKDEYADLSTKLKQVESEKQFLEKMVNAYEALSNYSRSELDEAYQIIKAHEQNQELSRQERMILIDQLNASYSSVGSLEKEIIQILDEDPYNEEYIVERFNFLRDRTGDDFFVSLFKILVNIEFLPSEARSIWNEISANKLKFSKSLGRNISFRVAMLDYFINYNKRVKNPKIIEIKLYEKALKSALIDTLTGVFNRRYYDEIVENELNRSKRHNQPLSLFLLDIDNFKIFNDRYGHIEGDQVLKTTGTLLKNFFRKEDIVCRYGGEEFVVIMPMTSTKGALGVTNRFRDEFKTYNFGYIESVTFSGGIATYPNNCIDKFDLFIKADIAMYRAKASGKDKIISIETFKN